MVMINRKLKNDFKAIALSASAGASLLLGASPALAQAPDEQRPGAGQIVPRTATYADLVTLAERGGLVVRAGIRRQLPVPAERAPGLAPGFSRFYIEAETLALIAGSTTLGEDLVYLIDLPLDQDGDPPKLKGREVLLFADLAGRSSKGAAQLQLTGGNSQLAYSPALEARLRPILTELLAAKPPPRITGISDALAVEGTLVGESETQIFLETRDGSPVSLSVLRRPGQPPRWGASWGEIIDSAASAPEPETLRWFRLACSLPDQLPATANIGSDPAARRLATRDYAYLRETLGPCERLITDPE